MNAIYYLDEKRWVITSSAMLEMLELIRNEYEDKTVLQGLAKYLNGTFHGYWSTYSVASLSVLIDPKQGIESQQLMTIIQDKSTMIGSNQGY